MQAQAIVTKTVVSLHMGLYWQAKRLQMGRNDLDHLNLCPGVLHIVQVQLWTIGGFIEHNSIDLCRIEADL